MIKSTMRAAQKSIVFFPLMLAACGGGGTTSGGGGVVSTPTPASYTKLADMTGDRSFQTAGVQYRVVTDPPAYFAEGATQSFGSGVVIAYTAASDSYKLTAADGSTVTFTPADTITPGAEASLQRLKTNGAINDQLTIFKTAVNGVSLSYLMAGSWVHRDPANNASISRLAIGGSPTIASDMPRSGSATYSTAVNGTMLANGTPFTLTGSSTATFSADFAANSVATALTLTGVQSTGTTVANFGTFSGTGAISSSNSAFTGTLSGTGATGVFSGAFFGPQAKEMGYSWFLNAGIVQGAGFVVGVKN